MARLLILLFALAATAASVPAQAHLTSEERAAAIELADRFESRLDESGDITALANDMFIADHVSRYVKEMKARRASETTKSATIVYVSGIEYEPALLDQASERDWAELYVQTFDFMHHSLAGFLNRTADSMLANGGLDDDEIANGFAEMYPAGVTRLFEDDPILRNLVLMKDRRPIRTVNEMRGVTATLKTANGLLRKDGRESVKLTSGARKVLKTFRDGKDDEFGPWLSSVDREAFGFRAGTRLIVIFSAPMHRLVITRVGGTYKIVNATFGTPD